MEHHTTVIIGAGQTGLAMSHTLTEHGIDHVVLERGDVANSWQNDRWDSLRLLTPNWQSRLPGDTYLGAHPEGFMAMPEVVSRLAGYADRYAMPVRTHTEVLSVDPIATGFRIMTTRGPMACQNLVLANGACAKASVPRFASDVPASLPTFTALGYKRPSDLPDGGVLVVGGSATGVQLARELQASGRQVILSLGEHVRAPRRYRGQDIKSWMDATGLLDIDYRDVDDLNRVRRLPSLQLVGGTVTIDLNTLQADGVEIAGKLAMIRDGKALFSGGLANNCAMADLKMNRLLNTIDTWVEENGMRGAVGAPERYAPTTVPAQPRLDLDLNGGEVGSILWATGYRPDYSWLNMPVFDRKGRLDHDGGVVNHASGLYALGLPYLRCRKSTLIDGAGNDARALADHMANRLACCEAA